MNRRLACRRDDAARWSHLVGRRLLTGAVHRLPPSAADPLRGLTAPARARRGRHRLRLATVHLLRRGGIPGGVQSFTLVDNAALRFMAADSLVTQQLYWFGEQGWEPEVLPWWRYFCRRSQAILELGANVGYYTVQAARAAPHARYTAVEPHPESVRLCRANLALNGIDSVHLVGAAAVADSAQASTDLVVPWEQLAAPTVAFMPAGAELPSRMSRRPSRTVKVPTVDVRSLVRGVDLLKLDVEGQEHELLEAVRDELPERRPTIVVEVLPDTPRLRALLANLCGDLGYRCYAAAGEGLQRVDPRDLPTVSLQERYGSNDLILCADPDLPLRVADIRGADIPQA